MNNSFLSLPRVALVALALGYAGVTATFAQTTTSTTTTTPPADTEGGWHHHRGHHGSVLTDAEKAQFHKAKETALAANPSLKTQKDALRAQFEALKSANLPATKEQFEALHQQAEQLHQQLRTAELAADPTLGPILQKLDAAHQGHGHHHHADASTT